MLARCARGQHMSFLQRRVLAPAAGPRAGGAVRQGRSGAGCGHLGIGAGGGQVDHRTPRPRLADLARLRAVVPSLRGEVAERNGFNAHPAGREGFDRRALWSGAASPNRRAMPCERASRWTCTASCRLAERDVGGTAKPGNEAKVGERSFLEVSRWGSSGAGDCRRSTPGDYNPASNRCPRGTNPSRARSKKAWNPGGQLTDGPAPFTRLSCPGVPSFPPPSVEDNDACAIYASVRKDATPSPEPVARALVSLQKMLHRAGNVDGEGDGCGLLVDIPRKIWAEEIRAGGHNPALALEHGLRGRARLHRALAGPRRRSSTTAARSSAAPASASSPSGSAPSTPRRSAPPRARRSRTSGRSAASSATPRIATARCST